MCLQIKHALKFRKPRCDTVPWKFHTFTSTSTHTKLSLVGSFSKLLMMMLRHQFPEYSFHSDSSLFDSGLNQRIKDYKSSSNMDSNRTSSGKHWNKAVYHEQVGSIQSIQYFDQPTIPVSSTNDFVQNFLQSKLYIKKWGITLVARHLTSRSLNVTSCKLSVSPLVVVNSEKNWANWPQTNKVTISQQILWTLKRYFCSSVPIP